MENIRTIPIADRLKLHSALRVALLAVLLTSCHTALADDYAQKLAFLETSSTINNSKYDVINNLGYLGKYQFSKQTLEGLGYSCLDIKNFLQDTAMQETALLKLKKENSRILFRAYKLEQFIGTTINGIVVTRDGLLAAAHLLGPFQVKKYLQSAGSIVPKDGFDTSIEKYLSAFQ